MVDFDALSAPFPPQDVDWRLGKTVADKGCGLALAYIDARAAMDRLDAVCGPGGWQNKYSHAQGTVVCEIGIKIGDEWVWKADGAGATQVEAEKGSLSDAFKRSAVRWGIGRYLYDLKNTWVQIEPQGRSFKIKEDQWEKLRRVAAGAQQPSQTKPQYRDHQAPVDAEALKKAQGWADNFLKALKDCPGIDYVDESIKQNAKFLQNLQDRFPSIHKGLSDAIEEYKSGLAA